jgi:hypothetical protein
MRILRKWRRCGVKERRLIFGRLNFRVGKYLFIEYNIPRDVNLSGRNMEALIAFMHATISQEYASLGSELEFSIIIRTKTRPTCTSKCFEERVIRCDTK